MQNFEIVVQLNDVNKFYRAAAVKVMTFDVHDIILT